MQILANKLNEGEILSKMGAYDRNIPYNDLPLLPPGSQGKFCH